MSQAAIFDTPILKWPFAVRPSSAPCGMAPMAVPVTLVQPLEAPLAAAPAAPKAAVQAGALVAVAATTIVVSVATATDMSLSLGGTTGYAINPVRDLGPRLMHALLPIPRKRDSDWSYAWVPVLGPLVGGILAALVFRALK